MLALSYCLVLTHLMGEKSYDDAYITYRYAKNLADGEGFAYNPADPDLGTTTPLLTMVLAACSRLLPGVSIPVIGQWLTGLSLWALCLAVYLLLAGDGSRLGGAFAGVLVLSNPWLVVFWGGEALLSLSLVTFAFVAYRRRRQAACGLLAGLAFLARGEGALVLVILITHSLWLRRGLSGRLVLGWAAVALPWCLFAMVTFGTALPSSLGAKIAQMHTGYFTAFLPGAIVLLQKWIGTPGQPGLQIHFGNLLLVVLAALGSCAHWRFLGGSHLLLTWIVLYALGYTVLRVPFYTWYIAPIMLALIVLAGLGAQLVYEWVRARRLANRETLGGLLALSLLLMLPVARGVSDISRRVESATSYKQRLYTATGHWLAVNTADQATVGYFEIGFMGYHSRRAFVDPAGLINRGVAEHLARGDFKWAYLFYRPDYLIINPVRWYERLGSISDESWFDKAYSKVTEIDEAGYFDAPLTIYRKVNDAAIPRR